jgi:hypothetical protein
MIPLMYNHNNLHVKVNCNLYVVNARIHTCLRESRNMQLYILCILKISAFSHALYAFTYFKQYFFFFQVMISITLSND